MAIEANMSIEERIGLCSHCLCDTTRFCHTDCHAYSKYRGATEQRAIDLNEFKEYLEKKRDSITNYAQARMYAPIYNEIINELFGE